MNDLFRSEVLWSIAVIVIVPVVIVGRPRSRNVCARRSRRCGVPLRTVRTWVLPFFAIWTLLLPVLAVRPTPGTTGSWPQAWSCP